MRVGLPAFGARVLSLRLGSCERFVRGSGDRRARLRDHRRVEMRSEDLYHLDGRGPRPLRVREHVGPRRDDARRLPDARHQGRHRLHVAVPVEDAENFLGFETTVDGKPVETKVQQRASALGVDQTALLKRARRSARCRRSRKRAPRSIAFRRRNGTGSSSSASPTPRNIDAGKGWERHLAPLWLLSTDLLLGADLPGRQDRRSSSIATSRASARRPASRSATRVARRSPG